MTIEELAAKLETVSRERDEAWAAWEKGTMFLADAERERNEARAEVATAYRRGAEAMREACIAWARAPEIDWEALPDVLEEMPIPEEP